MRNLKRVLSLALACVMVIGMMVMTTGAADFTDADEITYTEAVEVAAALGMIEGIENKTDGTFKFNPNGVLTREGAAKLICYMLLGKENAEMLVATKTFTDVKETRWSAPYISYCSSLGFIDGIANGDGTYRFNPSGKLTGLAFSKLLLCALGYDAKVEGYVGKDWATNIGSDAIDAGLNIKGVNLNAELTREQAAQMILNTLKAPMVEYETKGSSITVNGAEIVFGSSKATYVTTTLAKEQRISRQTLTNSDLYTVEFGEKYFPALSLVATEDAMARPAHEWLLKNESIGLYTEAADYEGYIAGKNTDVEKLVDSFSKRFDDTKAEVFVNGLDTDAALANKDARGNYVEIYMNEDDATLVDRICITHNTVDVVGTITTTVAGEVTYVNMGGNIGTVASDKIVGWEDVDTKVIMYYQDNEGVYHVTAPEHFTGKLTAGTDAKGLEAATNPKYLHIAGETYEISGQTDRMGGTELVASWKGVDNVTYWLDGAGYVIYGDGTVVVEPEVLLMVLKNNDYKKGTIFKPDTVQSQVLFMDGTVKIIDIASVDGKPVSVDGDGTVEAGEVFPVALDFDNANEPNGNGPFVDNAGIATASLYAYEIDSKTGAYKLTTKNTKTTDDINLVTGIPSAFETKYADKIITDSKTVYLVRDVYTTDGGKYADSYTVYTGFASVPGMTIKAGEAEIYGTGVAQYVVVNNYTLTEEVIAVEDSVYILDEDITAHYKDGKVDYFTVSVLLNGEKTTLKIANGAKVDTADKADDETVQLANNPLKDHTLYIIDEYNSKDNVTHMTEAVTSGSTTKDGKPVGTFYWVNMYGSQAAKNDKIVLGDGVSFAYDEKCVVYTISAMGDIVTVGDITTLATDDNDKISIIVKGKAYGKAPNNTAVEIYVYKVDAAAAPAPVEPEAPVDGGLYVDIRNAAAVKVFADKDAAAAPTLAEKLTAIEAKLAEAGFTITKREMDSGSYKWSVSDSFGFPQGSYVWNPADVDATAQVLPAGTKVEVVNANGKFVTEAVGTDPVVIYKNGAYYVGVGQFVITFTSPSGNTSVIDKSAGGSMTIYFGGYEII